MQVGLMKNARSHGQRNLTRQLPGVFALAIMVAGIPIRAFRMPHELLVLAERRHVDVYSVALIYAGLGQQDQAIDWLDKACSSHSCTFSFQGKSDPRLDGLRSDPGLRKC